MHVQIQYFEACSSLRYKPSKHAKNKLHIGLLLMHSLTQGLYTVILCLVSNANYIQYIFNTVYTEL